MRPEQPLLNICHASADYGWVHGRMLPALGLEDRQYRTRADDSQGELQLDEIRRAVEECRFTVLVASSAARWDRLAQFAASLAQHAALEQATPRLIIIARDFAFGSEAERMRLSLDQRALVGLDCSDEARTTEALARLRKLLALVEPVDQPPACPYPGLARFTAANRDLLFGRDGDRRALVQRIRARHSRILVVGPSGSGKSSLIHAAVLPELSPEEHVIYMVPRGGALDVALCATVDALDVAGLGAALERYAHAVRDATGAQVEAARAQLRALSAPDARHRLVVVDPLEEVFTEDDPAVRAVVLALLSGLWSLPWCTVILCMRADFYGALMVEPCWRELEASQYAVTGLDETGLRDAIVEPARRAGVHVDAALVERLIREIDRDRSSMALPLLQVALKELWTQLRWRYLTLADYERIMNHRQRGLAAVLAVHAEAVMQALVQPDDRAVAQRVVLDLVHLGEGRPHTRRQRTFDELRRSSDAPAQLERVLDALADGRLVTTSDGGRVAVSGHLGAASVHDPKADSDEHALTFGERHIDLAHDALITGWPALARWIAEHRDQLRTQRRLEARAATRALLGSDELPQVLSWISWTATPAGHAFGASEALRHLVRRSVVARRFRRGAFVAGAIAVVTAALVFGLQTRMLREERTKTQQSISKAAETAELIVYQLDTKLRTVACAEAFVVRDDLLKRARELFDNLRSLGTLSAEVERTETASKLAQAAHALERGRLNQAEALYREVLADAQRRVALDASDSGWQRDLSVSYSKLGEVAVSAGKLEDARGWFAKSLVATQALAMLDASNSRWQRDLSLSSNLLGELAVSEGRLEDARDWFARSLAVREALTTSDPSNSLWQRDLSVSYERLGGVMVSVGQLQAARGWFARSLAVRETLAAADPSHSGRRRDLSVSYERLGEVAVAAGKLEDARRWFEKSLAVREMLAAADPGNSGWQRDISVSYERLGGVALSGGGLEDARDWFEKALAVTRTLVAADPSNSRWRRDLSVSYDRMGDVALSAGKLEGARDWFERSLAVGKELATSDPSNSGWQRDLSVAYNKLGDVAVREGKLADARDWFEKSLAVGRELAAADPSNSGWQRDLSVAYNKLGDVAVREGKLERARDWFEKSLAVREALAAADPSNRGWQRDLSVSCNKLGEIALRAGKLDDARRLFETSLAVGRTLTTADPSNRVWQRDLSVSYNKLGEVAVAAGKLEQARSWFEKALAIARNLAGADRSNSEWQLDLCTSLARSALLARNPREARRYLDEARKSYGELQRGGYFKNDVRFTEIGAGLDSLAAQRNIAPSR
jgi:tetratricopeptide (TPR) repeat protein